MAKEVFKVIPVAERMIEFQTEDVENALIIVDGWGIERYASEYPIVHYRCDEFSRTYLEGEPRLNSFIESITVSKVRYGEKAWFESRKLGLKFIDCDTVAYYTDKVGINHAIIQYDIYKLLCKKPNLVVSPEGVLVLFTDKKIIATVDCNSDYNWIDWHDIDVKGKTIKNIEVCEDYCKVILLDDEKVEHCFSLKFDFDISARHMICPKVSKL